MVVTIILSGKFNHNLTISFDRTIFYTLAMIYIAAVYALLISQQTFL
jgi:hypothetical protein